MKETVLLTGGAGFIGSHIAVELLQRDYDVVIADDLSNSRPDVPERIEKITGRAPVFWENSHRAILARLRSMTAADFAALDQGRDVFAVPGPIDAAASVGCNRLIRDSKAALLESAQGFMEAMGWPCRKKEEKNGKSCFELFPDLCEEEQRIVDCLRQHDKLQINMLTVATNLPVHKLSAFLFNLEMKGIIKQLSGGMYRLL